MSDPRARMLHIVKGDRPQVRADLSRAAAAGDPAAFAALFDEYAPLVRTMLRRQLGPSVEVDDLTQEVFLRVFRRIGALRNPDSIRSFVMGFVIRVARAELTRRWMRRWLFLTPSGHAPETSVAPADYEARQALDRLYQVLDGFSPQGRALFVLRHVEGLEIDEIAEVVGTSASTIKRRLARLAPRVFARIEKDPVLAQVLRDKEARA